MSEEAEQVQQGGEGTGGEAQEFGPPSYLAPGSYEDRMMADLGEIVERYPELTDERYAAQAGATAAHIARELGDEELAGDPMILELAHMANLDAQHGEQAAQAAQAAQPPDPVDAIVAGGKAGGGSSVLPF